MMFVSALRRRQGVGSTFGLCLVALVLLFVGAMPERSNAAVRTSQFCVGYLAPKTWCKTSNVFYWGAVRAKSNNPYPKCIGGFWPDGSGGAAPTLCDNAILQNGCYFNACERADYWQRSRKIRAGVYNNSNTTRWMEGTIWWNDSDHP